MSSFRTKTARPAVAKFILEAKGNGGHADSQLQSYYIALAMELLGLKMNAT
jgi:hypothetical protein